MKIQLTLILLLIALIGDQKKDKTGPTPELIKTETDKIYEKLVKIRRDFHTNPELAGNEKRTQAFVKQYLLDLGLEVETDTYGHSVVGVLKGKKGGKKIAWRADMDALPHDFADVAEFKSQVKGVQHGCGHDVHMAIGLGIAEILAKHRESIKGTVYFIFQPEEETFAGAKKMIENGLFTKLKPEEIYGLHVTALPVGQIMVKPNEIFAYQKRVRIKLKNEVSVAEAKELGKKIRNSLTRIKANSKPWEIQQIVDPKTGLANENTIFKDYLIMDDLNANTKNNEIILEAYLYETDRLKLQKIIPQIEQVIEANNYKDKLLSVSFTQENPTILNDEKLTTEAIKSLETMYGNKLMVPDYGQVPYFNDDFAYFQQKVPGVYFLLGGSNFEKGIIAMNHAPNFNVDEECIKVGVRSFSSLIAERLKKK